MDVCHILRADREKKRPPLPELAQKGYCAALNRWFFGAREHLVVTPCGYIKDILQVAGNRHDTQGLYALMNDSFFTGLLLADNAYWANSKGRDALLARDIVVAAESKDGWRFQYPPITKAWLHLLRGRVERRIGLFDDQFHARKTRCRSERHYRARRYAKALAHNGSRHMNAALHRPADSVAHFRAVA